MGPRGTRLHETIVMLCDNLYFPDVTHESDGYFSDQCERSESHALVPPSHFSLAGMDLTLYSNPALYQLACRMYCAPGLGAY